MIGSPGNPRNMATPAVRTRRAECLEELEYAACEVACISCYMYYVKRWLPKCLGYSSHVIGSYIGTKSDKLKSLQVSILTVDM